jgi:acyl-[acyl-carrier-protein]-phospholipid O-acyltransferase/long-chain-fatty-acid--[acyl-carrier-protein] ligase
MNLHEKLIKVIKKHPKNTAVIDSATGKNYTYGKLLLASMLFAGIIKKQQGEFIGIMMPMSAGAFISVLAAMISGKVPVMINYSTGAENNVRYARKKCGFRTVITSKKLCDKLGIADTSSFFLPLLSGSAVNTFANPLEYKYVAEGIKKNKNTIITATPTFLRGYCMKSEPGDFKTLRIIMAGGDKLTKNLKEMWEHKHGLEVLEGYGTTETSPVISVNTQEKNRFGSIGQVIPGAKVKIIDIDTEQPLPAGQEGKIYVKGRLVMKGYFNDMEETSLHIRNGWYDTGDIGLIDEDGFLWHKGRLKRFVKIGGEMISLTAVENAVERYISEDDQCCAAEIPHVTKGAEIVVATTSDMEESVIKKKLAAHLPPIAIPKKILYFNELPLMGNGKVNFREVEDMCRNQI